MNHKTESMRQSAVPQPSELPAYPCTSCPNVQACDLSELGPFACSAWAEWNAALEKLGTEYVAHRIAVARPLGTTISEEDAAVLADGDECPCDLCPNPACTDEPDGKGSCMAFCAWKCGLNWKEVE